ncbi:MAG: amidohydrolase [Ichthyobacteriaceae bacterium]|nr:amidohydrolase [Ichthyobacteriaceae bacterium]
MSELRIALIQTHIFWENPKKNIEELTIKVNSIDNNVDIIILPEMFSTGFTLNSETEKHSMNGKTVNWMKEMANTKDCAIVGSLIIEENGRLYNRALFVYPDGEISYYDKKHLFTLANEHKNFTAGSTRTFISYKNWKILPLTCYDLRFPEWSRNTNNYDLLIYVASWPERRKEAWKSLLKARAIENLTYVAATNRVGLDGNDIRFSGNSTIIDFQGKTIADTEEYEEDIIISTIKKEDQIIFRTKFPFLDDMDVENIQH